MKVLKYKDQITNACAFITVVSSGVIALEMNAKIVLAEAVRTALYIAPVIALALTQILTGKTPQEGSKDE